MIHWTTAFACVLITAITTGGAVRACDDRPFVICTTTSVDRTSGPAGVELAYCTDGRRMALPAEHSEHAEGQQWRAWWPR